MRFWDDLDVYDYAASLALSEEDRANLVRDLERKFRLPTPPPADFLDTLSPEVRKRVEVLKDIQGQHDKLEVKFLEERAAHEVKYLKLYEPLYTKRYEIVNGVVDVEGATNEAPMDKKEDKSAKEKGVPNFWLNTLRTNELLEDGISKRDERALKYLKDIKWCGIDKDKHKGFKLEFFFDANPYFKNSILTKTYQTFDYNDDTSVEEAIGTEIEWYSGKNLTETLLKPGKGSKNAQPITKRQKIDSFFNFFNPPQISTDGYDIDEGLIAGFRYQMKEDYDIGSTIREKIIPRAVARFTGEAADRDDDFEDGDEDETKMMMMRRRRRKKKVRATRSGKKTHFAQRVEGRLCIKLFARANLILFLRDPNGFSNEIQYKVYECLFSLNDGRLISINR